MCLIFASNPYKEALTGKFSQFILTKSVLDFFFRMRLVMNWGGLQVKMKAALGIEIWPKKAKN
jgi:hypothetical protein